MSDLVHLAAALLALDTHARTAKPSTRDLRLVQLERGAIHETLHMPTIDLPASLFSSEGRLLAWTCARVGGHEEDQARLALATIPRLPMPLEVWTALLQDAELELDRCATVRAPKGACERLLRDGAHRIALAKVLPHIEALARGRPLPDTPDTLRAVADWIERVGAEESEAA